MGKITNIPGRLHSVEKGNVVTGANEIYDDDKQKKQSVINKEVDEAIEDLEYFVGIDQPSQTSLSSRVTDLEVAVGTGGSVDSRIADAKSEIKGSATSACDTLGEAEALISAETSRAQAAEGALQQLYENLTQSDIVVVEDHTQVASPSTNTIYREMGETSYIDWMYYDSAWKKMAEYDNAIDDDPTPESDNLVKSGGVDKAFASLGMTSSSIINKYIAEIYIYDSSVTLTQVDFAIASYVSTVQYAGKYLNMIRLRTSAGNKTIYSEYCDSEAIALSNFRQVTSKKVIALSDYNNYMVCLSNRDIETTSLVSGTPTFATYSDLSNLPNIKNYFQDNDIVNKTGQELTLNSVINGYIKELVYSNQNQSTVYVKVYVYIGYKSSSVYYNTIAVDEFDSTDTRILRTELVKNTYNTLEDALADIPTGLISGDWGEVLLADNYPFTESFAVGEKVLHSLTYDYAPILKEIKAEEEMRSDINNINKVISTGYLYKDDVLVANPYINYTMILTEGSEYVAEVKLKDVLDYDVKVYIRRYPGGTTTNIASATIKAGDNYARLTFKAGETNTNQHRIVITNTGQDSYNADVSVKVQEKSLKVLLVGSSFGVNTISMFPVLAREAGVDITCGSLYYGSASIGLVNIRPLAHQPSKFALNQDYGWYKKFINGAWESGTGTEGYRTYQYALQDEQWDIIIMQRGAEELRVNVPWSDMQTSCLQQMIEYTRTHCDYEPEILFADGLANPVGWGSVPQTRESQIAQTEHIISTAQEMKSKFGINVIPVGVALQNARLTLLSQYGYHGGSTEYPGDMACDSQHLDAGIGYYVTGATLFEYILNPRFGLSIMNLDYLPVVNDVKNCWVRIAGIAGSDMFHGISVDNINIAKYAVLDAIADPLHVSTTLGQRYSAMYNVTQNLINCKSCFQNTRCETTFFALITPDEGYALGTPTITMGGTDITSTVYSTTEYDNIVFGVISIPNVTGDIVINLQAN